MSRGFNAICEDIDNFLKSRIRDKIYRFLLTNTDDYRLEDHADFIHGWVLEDLKGTIEHVEYTEWKKSKKTVIKNPNKKMTWHSDFVYQNKELVIIFFYVS